MANQMAQEELLLDIRVAEASRLYKFYLIQEKKILGTAAVILFLTTWELCGNTLQLINPMFMSAPSFVFKAAYQMFASGRSITTCTSVASNFSGDTCFPLLSPSLLGSPSVGTSDSPTFATHLLTP